uniref:C2H2-type domain-containing protein n=1 Tax=Maylandia zebra TaxID=106582 RepID=A0A3P9DE59_9CICH
MWHNGALCNCFSILAHLRPHWAVAYELTLLLNNIGVNARGCSIFSIICPVYLPSLLSKLSQPVLSKPLCLTYSFLIFAFWDPSKAAQPHLGLIDLQRHEAGVPAVWPPRPRLLPEHGSKAHGPQRQKGEAAHRQPPYGCEHCPKAFTTAAHLKEHLKIHSGFKPHRCVVCGKAFIRGPDLKRHERVHSNERPFACQMCEKAFKHKSHLKDHERQHRGERPFNCGSCDKAFIKASDLKRHWNTMHISLDGKPAKRRELLKVGPQPSLIHLCLPSC